MHEAVLIAAVTFGSGSVGPACQINSCNLRADCMNPIPVSIGLKRGRRQEEEENRPEVYVGGWGGYLVPAGHHIGDPWSCHCVVNVETGIRWKDGCTSDPFIISLFTP